MLKNCVRTKWMPSSLNCPKSRESANFVTPYQIQFWHFSGVHQNNLVETIDKWGPEFEITFRFWINSNMAENVWHNFFHLTSNDKDCCQEGARLPGVWFTRGPRAGNFMQIAYANSSL